jgi:methyl-accepting chemotaxis protein
VAAEDYVTYKELSDSKQDLMEHIEQGNKRVDRLDDKVDTINDRVGHLNDLVLPLTVAMKQTAENTREISESLKEFTKSQSETNDRFHEKISSQAVTIEGMKSVTAGITDKKKYNATVVVAIIGLVGVFVTGLFQLAPLIFN